MKTSFEKTVDRYYGKAIVMLQKHIAIANNYEVLRETLIEDRPKRYRKIHWAEAVEKIIEYVDSHKESFKDGKLYA